MNLNQVIELWRHYSITKKGNTDNTLNDYEVKVRVFCNWLDKDVLLTSESDIESFKTYMISDRKVCGRTFNQYKIALSSLFYFLRKSKIIDDDPTEEIENAKIVKKYQGRLSQSEVLKVLSYNNYTPSTKARNKLVILLALKLGLRVSEICNLQLSTVKEDVWQILTKITDHQLEEQYRMIDITGMTDVRNAIDDYIKVRNNSKQAGLTELLISQRGSLTIKGVQSMFNAIEDRTGVKCNPHRFRRTLGTMVSEAEGTTDDDVSIVLGHGNNTVAIAHYIDPYILEMSRAKQANKVIKKTFEYFSI